jgi:hypothetical protein
MIVGLSAGFGIFLLLVWEMATTATHEANQDSYAQKYSKSSA